MWKTHTSCKQRTARTFADSGPNDKFLTFGSAVKVLRSRFDEAFYLSSKQVLIKTKFVDSFQPNFGIDIDTARFKKAINSMVVIAINSMTFQGS